MAEKTREKSRIPETVFDLKTAMRAAECSQRQLAMRLGIDEGHISKLARGLIRPQWSTAVAVARALGLSLDAFVGPPPSPRRRRTKAG